jgi:hypothetical protein
MRVLFLCAFVLLAGCSVKAGKKEPVRAICTRFGEQCEVAPGKLGSCVLRDNCVGKDCFVCQAQH